MEKSSEKTPPCAGHDAESAKIESSSDDRPVLHTQSFFDMLSEKEKESLLNLKSTKK